MKRIFSIVVILLMVNVAVGFSQTSLSPKELKGVKVQTDSFDNKTFYTAAHTGLFVVVDNGSCRLNWTLSAADTKAIKIEGVKINVDGILYDVGFDLLETQEYHKTPVKITYFYSKTTFRAEKYFDLLEKIISSKGTPQIRFFVRSFSETRYIDGSFNEKNKEATRKILNIYNKLSAQ